MASQRLYELHYTGWHLLANVGRIKVPMMQLAIVRKLTDTNLTSFESFLEDKGVFPNYDTPIKLADIGQWICGAEKMGYIHAAFH